MDYRKLLILLILFLAILTGAVSSNSLETDSFSGIQVPNELRTGGGNLLQTALRNLGRTVYSPLGTVETQETPIKPDSGKTLLSPEASREGYWVGAPSAVYDEGENKSYIYYRYRSPLRRGWKSAVAEINGDNLTELWSIESKQSQIMSLEGGALQKKNSSYRLFMSYQDSSGQWKIARLEAEKIQDFNFSQRKVLDIEVNGFPHTKDPVIFNDSLIVHSASQNFLETKNFLVPLPYNASNPVKTFTVGGEENSDVRITSVIDLGQEKLVFYDWKRNIFFTGEEKTRAGLLSNTTHVSRLTPPHSVMASQHSTGSFRYIDALDRGKQIFLYYESALPTKAHDLKFQKISKDKLVSAVENWKALEKQ